MYPVERVRKLFCNLPETDQGLAENFIQRRDFESLKELVDSAIYKVRKNARKENPNPELLKCDQAELNNLKSEVDFYLLQINGGLTENGREEY